MRVCFLLERGTPPRLNPVYAALFAWLAERGVDVQTWYPEEDVCRLDTLTVEADLYLLKSDTELALSLATTLAGLGGRVLNTARASALAKDKVVAAAILHQAGILTPRSLAAGRPASLVTPLADSPLILKPPRGYHGAGVAIVDSPAALPPADNYPDVVFAQDYLARARTDLKVFVIGEYVFGVRKPFAADSYRRAGEPTPVTAQVEDMARRVGHAFGLALYGLDLAETEAGVYVMDVNYFPGYRGVPDAARRLGEYIQQKLAHTED